MTKIKNTAAYPIKKYPIPTDFFIGSDSENSGETVNFEIQNIINMASGLKDYIFSLSSLPIVSPQGDGYFQTNGIKNFASITSISISKKTLAGQNLTPFMTWLGSNLTEFTLYIVSKKNQNIFADFSITNVTEQTDYFVFTVDLAPGDNYLGELIEKDIYTFNYEKTASGSFLDLLTQTITDGDTLHAPSGNAVYDALILKAPLLSPGFTGIPTAPTAAPGTNTIQLANTAFVTDAFISLDGNVLHKTGNESWTGIKSSINTGTSQINGLFLTSNGTGSSSYVFRLDNLSTGLGKLLNNTGGGYGDVVFSNSGYGRYTDNSGFGVGEYILNKSSNAALRIESDASSSAPLLEFYKAGAAQTRFNENGRYTIIGGTASQFLKADGSIDSNVYAPLASPAFTGNPTAPTPLAGDNDTSIATTAFVTNAIATAGTNYVTLNTNQTITAQKTFSNNTMLDRVIMSNYISHSNLNSLNYTTSYGGGAIGAINGHFSFASNNKPAATFATDNVTPVTAPVLQIPNASGTVALTNNPTNITAPSFIKTGGLASQFLKADGSVDSTVYENTANKQNNLNYDGTGIKFPTVDATNNLTRDVAKFASKTGLISKLDTFNLIALDDFTARIAAVTSAVFWNELFVAATAPSAAIKSFAQKDYPLSQLLTPTGGNVNINPLTTDGKYVRYLGYDKNGNVFSSQNSFLSNNDVLQIGFVTILKVGSTISFLDGVAGPRNVFAQPSLASNTDFDKVGSTVTNITVSTNVGASIATSNGNITGISVNWKSAVNPSNGNPIDVFPYVGQATAAFRSINPLFLNGTAGLSTHTLWTELEDAIQINEKFFNTTTQLPGTMAAGTASVKRIMVGIRGSIYVQDGEHPNTACYPDLATAKNNIFSHKFSDAILPLGVTFEIARVAYTKGATAFQNDAQFYLVNTAGGTSAGSTVIPPVSDATTVSKGILKLAGDLGGTADLPTTPTALHITGNESKTGNLTINGIFTATTLVKSGAPVNNILLAGGGDIPQSTFAPSSGSGSYIQNQGISAQLANMWISGNGYFEGNILSNTFGGLSGGDVNITTNTSGTANLIFKTATVEVARINSNGNVGINNSNPTSKLDTTGDLTLRGIASDGTNIIKLGTYVVNGLYGSYISTDHNYSTTTDTNLKFGVTNGGFSLEAMRILANGNVGIGTASPAFKLDVSGSINSESLNTNIFNFRSDNFKTANASIGKFSTFTGGGSDFELIFNRSAAGAGAYYGIQSVEQAVGYRNIALNQNGGNVLIGTTTDNGNKLRVYGSGFFDGHISSFGGAIYNYGVGGVNSGTGAVYLNNGVDVITWGLLTGVPNAFQDGFSIKNMTDGNTALYIKNNGNLLINTLADSGARLQIAGALGGVIGDGGSSVRMTNTDTGNYASISAGIVGVANAGMEFSIDGARAMVIHSSSNVAIGTVTDNGVDKLQVNGSGKFFNGLKIPSDIPAYFGDENSGIAVHHYFNTANDQYRIANTSNGSVLLAINRSSGNVGIGTTSPAAKLTLSVPANSNTDAILIYNHNTDADSYTSIGSYYAEGNGNVYSQVRFGNTNATGGESFISFATHFGTLTEKMRITHNGLIGIGTSTPTKQLQIKGNGATLRLETETETDAYWTEIQNIYTGNGFKLINNNAFGANEMFGRYAYAFALMPNAGNVLIGQTTDNGIDKLQVNGSGKFNGTVNVTGDLNASGRITTASGFTSTSSNSSFFYADLSVGYSAYQGYTLAVNGTGYFNGAVTAAGGFFNSDARLKDIISRDGDVVKFKWKDGRDDKTHVGYIAQEVQEYMPDAVQEGADGMLSVNYIEVLLAKITAMEKEIKELKSKLN